MTPFSPQVIFFFCQIDLSHEKQEGKRNIVNSYMYVHFGKYWKIERK